MVAKWARFGGDPPDKTPGPTLDHNLIVPLGGEVSDQVKKMRWGENGLQNPVFSVEKTLFQNFRSC